MVFKNLDSPSRKPFKKERAYARRCYKQETY